jgi:tRNA modification GTPase
MVFTDDTIAAIATPLGTGGIGIIRISGPRSLEIATLLFRPHQAVSPLKSHHLYHGVIVDPEDGHSIDEVLLSHMAKPRSYTREDVIEINCHGGLISLKKILSLVLKAGARLAEPGEFTRRAFLNGRLDLAQAEAVIDLIESKSSAGARHASRQLQGALSREIGILKDRLVEILSLLEVSIDFPEEDLESYSPQQLIAEIDCLISPIERLVDTYAEGRLYKEGVSAVIAGKPNVGKSSLFNALLGEERTIVTSLPGTTRDFVEEAIAVGGIPLKITDTAGLRESSDSIEEEGVMRTKDKMDRADLIILVIDGSVDGNGLEIPPVPSNGRKIVVVCNKADLPQRVSLDKLKGLFPGSPVVSTSALYQKGIGELKSVMASLLISSPHAQPSSVVVSNLRHKQSLEKTVDFLKQARTGIESETPPEFVSTDIQSALHHLGEITGQTTTEELLDRIFSRFCIGK